MIEPNDTERMRRILDDLGIELYIGGCGCCESPWFTFKYNGETIVDSLDGVGFDNIQKPEPVSPSA